MTETSTDRASGFIHHVGAHEPEATDGRATLVVDVDERHLNHAGAVHGGLLATLVDTTMGAAIGSTLAEGSAATSQLTVTYLRPAKPGRLAVSAAVSKRGESLTVCEADIEQDGESLVHALATFALLDG
ncbi:PaaI family thioesterase [Nocardioides solisilvae]|uniref:PaaI family thioesterase n=1 Tax=Nocardioides solisilvae TaxID=1542435 RepID=UPI000D7411F6|nr:PaaI family thioesterase [Nocardioides solisilvae]